MVCLVANLSPIGLYPYPGKGLFLRSLHRELRDSHMQPKDMLLLILVAAIWGGNFTVIKLGLAQAPPLLLSAARFVITVFPAIFFVSRPKAEPMSLILIGLTLGLLMSLFQFVGMSLGASASIAAVALQSQALFTILLSSIVLKERIGGRQIAILLIGTVGLVFIGFGAESINRFAGVAFVIVAAFWWSVANIQIRRQGSTSAGALIIWISLIPIAPLLFLSGMVEGALIGNLKPLLTPAGMITLLYLGVGVMVVGYGIWGTMLQRYPASQVAPYSLLVPVFGMFFGWLVLDERLHASEWVGMTLILVAVALTISPVRTLGKCKEEKGVREGI